MKNERIEDYMTEFPVLATEDMSAREALSRMRGCGFRHLPVVRSHQVTGIVSERDLLRAQNSADAESAKVSEYMSHRPYCATTNASILEVVRQMSKHKYGSAVIVSPAGKIAGIFTNTDALDLLARVIEQNPNLSAHGMRIDDYLPYSPSHEV